MGKRWGSADVCKSALCAPWRVISGTSIDHEKAPEITREGLRERAV